MTDFPRYSVESEGPLIRCSITVGEAMAAPVFCFSLMVTPQVVSGGRLIRDVGGYGEAQLPDLVPGLPHEIVLRYADDTAPRNRAWLPLGAYLRRTDGSTVILPPHPLGVRHVLGSEPAPCPGLRLVPQPTAWQPTGGTLALQHLATDHPAFLRAEALARRTGLGPLLAPGGTPVTITQTDIAPGGYGLTIAEDGITLEAGDDGGIFHAAITLLTLRQTHAEKGGGVPCGTLQDAPRFGWRGQHLDCARHFFAVPTILRLLDLMALLKLNRFHWHFADDEAFRLALPGHPDLAARTALRGEGHPLPGVFGGGPEAGGIYSIADVKTVLARAAELGIEVVPEIEVPAHSYCLTTLWPGLRDHGDNGNEMSVQGYYGNALNPAMQATWDLLEPLAEEVAALFPFGLLHLGGDELAPETWDHSPAAHALKAREGLRSREDLQGWTMARLAAHLQRSGIRSAAWEEAARGNQGGIGHDALIFSWTGQGAGIDAARAGHDVVMCPGQRAYFDMAHTDSSDDWGATWAAILPLENTVDWRVVPASAPDIEDRIAGVQGCFWGEFTTQDRQMEPMLAPRLLGLACKAWEIGETTDGARLRQLAGAYGGLFDAIGWDWHRGA